jgi:hypothetical protein
VYSFACIGVPPLVEKAHDFDTHNSFLFSTRHISWFRFNHPQDGYSAACVQIGLGEIGPAQVRFAYSGLTQVGSLQVAIHQVDSS